MSSNYYLDSNLLSGYPDNISVSALVPTYLGPLYIKVEYQDKISQLSPGTTPSMALAGGVHHINACTSILKIFGNDVSQHNILDSRLNHTQFIC